MKDASNLRIRYLELAGFEAVKVVDESIFPLDCVINDPAAKVIMDDLKITPEQIKEVSASIASIKVQGLKPIEAG